MNPQKADMNEIDKLRDQLATAALRAELAAVKKERMEAYQHERIKI